MSARRQAKRRRPVRCPDCGGTARWGPEAVTLVTSSGLESGSTEGWKCEACGWTRTGRDVDGLEPGDGRIRSPADALDRLRKALEAAAGDGRLSTFDRAVYSVYCGRASELGWVEIMAGDAWVCERLGLDPGAGHRTRVVRARARLEALGYVKKLKEADVTHRGLKKQIATRKRNGKRPVTLLEVQKAPGYPTCERCGGEIPDIERVSKAYCSDRCRKAAWRADPKRLELYEMAERAVAGLPLHPASSR